MFARKDCCMPVDFDDYHHAYAGQIRNLGKGGAFVETELEELPEIGQEVFLTIPYQEGTNFLIIKGRVAWIHEKGVGVCFSEA
ncbi:MAG: PilZ domain-containing protein [Desulfobacteraceae bacterium]|nr:PilZ domain-containing protein [Desulfobacteraceae bacterium]